MPSSKQHTYRKFYRNSLITLLLVALFIAMLFWYKKPPTEEIQEATANPTRVVQQVLTRPSPPEVRFSEESQARGLDFVHNSGSQGDKLLPEAMGGGVAVFDVENDGDLDLFFTNGTRWDGKQASTGRLFLNDGQAQFTDHTSESGLNESVYGTGVAVADVNQDGWQDLFVAAVGKNHLYINQANGQFNLAEDNFDCDQSGWTTSAGFFDYDLDGDEDLLILNYIQWSPELDEQVNYQIEGIGKAYGPPNNFPGTQLCLFKNEAGSFVDVSTASGLLDGDLASKSKALGLSFWDLNQNGWLDIVVANDTVANQVFINDGKGHFTEQGGLTGLGFDAAGKSTGAMGIDMAYYQNDQRLAVAIGNFGSEATSFYVSREGLFYTDESMLTGIGPPSRSVVTFGVFFFDYDLDGRLDFFQTNGHVENLIQQVESSVTYEQVNQLFWHCGLNCRPTYEPVSDAGDLLNQPLVGRAAAYGDFDSDGDLDVVVTQVDGPVRLYMNQQNTNNHWLTLVLSTTDHRSLVGTRIEVTNNQATQRFVYSQTRSYQTQVQPWITIGLGIRDDSPVTVNVIENNGKTHQREFITVNKKVDWVL
jgi:hypothetical protein